MSSKLPTLKHTWQLDVNNVAAIGGSNLDCYQRSLFQLKEALTGFATFPWTVHSSSNGINHTNDGIPVLAYPDDSANSNDGTPNSMEASDIVTDVPGGSFSTGSTLFGGASFEYVSMGDATDLKFADTDSFSISCWAKWTSAGAMSVISKMQGSSLFTGYMLFVDAGHVDFFLINNFGAGQHIDVNTTATGFNDGAWHHIVVTYNGSSSASGVKIWVDGTDEPLTTNTDNLLASIDTTAVFAIANRPASVLPYTGNVDDVGVYRIALDGTQVAAIYNGGIPNDLRITGPFSDLIGYWRMEGIPTGVADLWLNSTNLVWATAPADHGWIVLQHPVRSTQICFDLKNSLGRHLAMHISYGGNFSGGDLTARPTANDEVFVETFVQWLGPLTGSFSSWVHVWHSNDGLRTRAYVATSAGTGEGAFFLFDEIDTPSPNWENKEIALAAFHGSLSGGVVLDVNRLVASNSFGTSNLPDFIGGGNVISWLGGPLKTTPTIYSEASTMFNDRSSSETEYALVGDVAQVKFAHTDPFSISCWIRSQFAANQFIISKREGGGNLRGYALYADATGEIVCQLYNVTVSNAIDVSTSGADISDGLWHHIVMTYDGNVNASGVAIYVDGVAVATVANIDNLTATIDNTTGLQISGRAGAAGGYVGNIDDVAIYDKELSPEEVATIYNGGNAVIPFTTKGVVFDGVNELIDMGNVSELDFTHTDTYSVSGWLKWTTLIGGMPWAKQEDSTNYRGYMMFTGTSGEIGVIIRNTHLTNLLRVVTTATGFNTGIWRHVVFTYDGSTNASGVHIYVDGVDQPLTITDDTLSATTTNSVPFQLGARDSFSGPGSNDWFKGAMDDVAVYNKELSQAEVTAIYNFGNPRLNTLLPSASNLVGYWLMGDGASFPTILDASTNSNDGTMTNMESSDIVNNVPFVPTFTSDGEPSDLRVDGPTTNLIGYWLMGDGDTFPTITDHAREGFSESCLLLGGTDEFVTMGDVAALKFAHDDAFSISIWFRADNANGILISKMDVAVAGWLISPLAGGAFEFRLIGGVGNVMRVTTGGGWLNGVWHHMVATWDGTVTRDAANASVYIDGVNQSLTVTNNTLSLTIDTTASFNAGSRNDGDFPWEGYIDDVAVYNKELSQAEVTTIYNDGIPNDLTVAGPTASLVGYWLMGDGDTFPTITDHAREGFSDNYLVFDGSNEYITMGDVAELNFTHTDPFSSSAWIRWTTTHTGIVVSKAENGGLFPGWFVDVFDSGGGNTGSILFILRNTDPTNKLSVTAPASLNDNIWHHVVSTYDGSTNASGVSIYIDGIVQSLTINDDTLSATSSTTAPFNISGRDDGAFVFDGQIDDVAVYDKELTSGEVTTIYNNGLPGDLTVIGPTASLVGYWLMGDGDTHPTITDQSVSANDGTMTNMEAADIVEIRSDGTMTNMEAEDIVGIGNDATCTGMETDDMPFGDTPGNPMVYTRLGFHHASSAIGSGMALNRRVAASVPNELDTKFPTITDLSANGNNGTATNMEPGDIQGDTPGGSSNYSMAFDGVNEYVSVPDDVALQFDRTDPFSLSVWYKSTESTNSTMLFSKLLVGSPFTGYELTPNSSGQIALQIIADDVTDNMVIRTTAGFHDGVWHHVVATWDGDVAGGAAGAKIYVDGVNQSVSITFDNLTGSTISTAPLLIGARNVAAFPMNGNIDDVAIYDKELTPLEVRTIYNNDSPAFSNNSLIFDGVNEYVLVGDVAPLKFSDTSSFSLSVWIRSSSATTQRIIHKFDGTSGYRLRLQSTGAVLFQLRSGGAQLAGRTTTATTFGDGEWHHITATYNGSGAASGMTIYVDGALEPSVIGLDSLAGSIDTTEPFRIGEGDVGGFESFTGNIDDVAVYSKELSSGEVTTIYNSANPPDLTTVGPTANLVGYWRMGDGATFPTILDDSTNSNAGTMTNMESGDIVGDVSYAFVGSPSDLTTIGPTANLVGYWTMGDDAGSPAYPIHPIPLMADYGYNGHHGFIDDMWWGSLDLANPSSSTYPNDPDNRQFAQVGEVVFPWTEDSTLPLLGGVGVVNDTFDGHFIDTSDLTGTGITKYFQMTGIDTGNPSQPAYHSWVVSDTPDPSGALATGPDAPPFGGPLTEIIVSAEWTD
jgi:hypothetical protein